MGIYSKMLMVVCVAIVIANDVLEEESAEWRLKKNWVP